MKHRHFSPPEVLESRIAPATIFVGDPNHNDSEYREGPGFGEPGTTDDPTFLTPFVNTATGAAAGDKISLVLGADPDVYYVKLGTGDRMVIFSGGYTNYITGPDGAPLKGDVVAVFQDKPHGAAPLNNEVDADELVGLSLGKNVKIQVSGTVFGDVIANYNPQSGSLGGSAEAPGSANDLLSNPIKLFAANAVKGTIAAGGAIKGIKVTNDVGQIFTGNAANGFTFDLNGTAADGGDILSVAPNAGQKGPAISHVSVGEIGGGSLAGKIQSGAGGAGAAGGKIADITIVADTSGWTLQGGVGGDGAPGRIDGGGGGKISKVLANGLDETQSDPSPNDLIKVAGGAGGKALAGGAAHGGNGGSVSGISIGYETEDGLIRRSVNAVADAVLIAGGAGGDGGIAGAGGKLKNDQVFAAPSLTGNDLIFRGGLGGASTLNGGKAGNGGSIKNADVRNPGNSLDAQASVARVEGGDGGASGAGAADGANGGSVKNANFIAFSVVAAGGDGSLGSSGGKGGKLTNISAEDGFQGVRPVNLTLDAGAGGTGTDQRGGGGGSIKNVFISNADFQTFGINQTGSSGDGGQSRTGTGGKGGSIANLNLTDLDSNLAADTNLLINAGDGGRGGDAPSGGSGGAGGSLKGQNLVSAIDTILTVNGGKGGNAPVTGHGGNGGKIGNFSYVASSTLNGGSGGATFQGGLGGAGGSGGSGGSGGKGGLINSVEALVDGTVLTAGGNGGNGGASGDAGAGGNVKHVALLSRNDAVTVQAGNGGALGATKGNGGSVSSANVLGTTAISILAGNGSFGGKGGNVKTVGVAASDQISGPLNTLTIMGGNGSAAGTVAGKGGSVTSVDGFIALTGLTVVAGGQGGAGSADSANGGSIKEVNFNGGRREAVDATGSEVRIVAGNAGNAASAGHGAKGGSVKGIGIGLNAFDPDPNAPFDPFSIDPLTIIRQIAAGNGGTAAGAGGAGGSINDVRVNADIGVRSGIGFGFSQMGGIFAGSGGTGGVVGTSGSVKNISADAIASIVAGRPENGDTIVARNLASLVTGITLNDTVATIVDGNGKFSNFDTANFVGAVVNPTDPGVPYAPDNPHPHANTFDPNADPAVAEFVDNDASGSFSIGDTTNARTDGFVAAVKYLNAKGINNVRPEALLTVDPFSGAFVFIDLNNLNGQVVVL
ncbi:MAG: hypothetical protein ABIO94_04180 [Opitutaceae bacterium]